MTEHPKDNYIHTDKYYLLYIDVLGMKSKINSDNSEKYLNDINNLYKKAIEEIKLLYVEISKIDIKVKIFSDNMIIAIKQGEKKYSSEDAIKHTIIVDIAARMYMLALLISLPIRGSLANGDFYIDENFVYGKVLTRAYYLENEIAVFPRIIIDDSAVGMFRASDYLRTIVKKDTDNIYYIDAFEGYFHVSKHYKENEIKCLKENLPLLLVENNCKINQKIYWLINRFNEYCINNDLKKYAIELNKL